jgi:NAD(P)-dependent dehydrogenase (short-subunit alcohol dehydrogenase family)
MPHPPGPIDTVVIVGAGAMGMAAARRLGLGRQVVLADYASERLDPAAQMLGGEGYRVDAMVVDVGDRAGVERLASEAARRGRLAAVVHTAGVSGQQASSRDIFRINLLGTAHVLDAFVDAASPGTVLTCIASMAGYRSPVPPAVERALATTPTAELLAVAAFDLDSPDTRTAYHLAKRGVQLRVQAAAAAWGARGARVNSISPGIIVTPMSTFELTGPAGADMRELIEYSPAGRVGTPDDIAAAVAFLSGPEASFITGTDLLVDGGATQLRRWGRQAA